jgi:hypothetical protein
MLVAPRWFSSFRIAGPVCAKAGGKFIIFWLFRLKGVKWKTEFGFHHIFRFLFEQMIREIIDKKQQHATRGGCELIGKTLFEISLATVSISWKSVAFSASSK